MKILPNRWVVNIRELNPELVRKFKDWWEGIEGKCAFFYDFYGKDGDTLNRFESEELTDSFQVISLKEWHEMYFPKEEFIQGEEVLVKNKHHESWFSAIFACRFEDRIIAKWEGCFEDWDECKKKPSELDVKIEELKALAKEKGLKVTINFE